MTKENKASEGRESLFEGSRNSLMGGLLAGSIALSGQWLVGLIYSGYEARQLLEALASSSLYLGSAVVTASATIIALMLTMIGLTRKANDDYQAVFLVSIKRIAQFSSVAMIIGILLLLFLSVPLQQSDKIPGTYYKVVYYILVCVNAVLSGVIVTIVLMLLNAINSLIEVIHPYAETEYSVEKQEASE